MIAPRVIRMLTYAVNQITGPWRYARTMLAILRKAPSRNGFPFTAERHALMVDADAHLTPLGFTACRVDGMPGYRYHLPAGHVEVSSTIHSDGYTTRVSWMVNVHRHPNRDWSEMLTIGEDLEALAPTCQTAIMSLLRTSLEDAAYRPRSGRYRALLR